MDVGAVPIARPQRVAEPIVGAAIESFASSMLLLALLLGLGLMVVATSEAIIGGASPSRIAIGAGLMGLWAAATARRQTAARLLQRPGRAALIAAAITVFVAVDGTLRSPYAAASFPVVVVAVVVESPAGVFGCLAVSVLGYLGGVLVTGPAVSRLLDGAALDTVLNTVVGFPAAAIMFFFAVRALRGILAGADAHLQSVRAGGTAVTEPLAETIRAAPRPSVLLPAGHSQPVVHRLSPAERRVIDLLAAGWRPKQVAARLGVSLPTVRSHIAAAKRKTGARTMEQLVGMAAALPGVE